MYHKLMNMFSIKSTSTNRSRVDIIHNPTNSVTPNSFCGIIVLSRIELCLSQNHKNRIINLNQNLNRLGFSSSEKSPQRVRGNNWAQKVVDDRRKGMQRDISAPKSRVPQSRSDIS